MIVKTVHVLWYIKLASYPLVREMYATWINYKRGTDGETKPERMKYIDPGFGDNSTLPQGDSRTYETSTPSGAYNNRMIPVNENGSVRIDGQHVFGRFGARPASYQEGTS